MTAPLCPHQDDPATAWLRHLTARLRNAIIVAHRHAPLPDTSKASCLAAGPVFWRAWPNIGRVSFEYLSHALGAGWRWEDGEPPRRPRQSPGFLDTAGSLKDLRPREERVFAHALRSTGRAADAATGNCRAISRVITAGDRAD